MADPAALTGIAKLRAAYEGLTSLLGQLDGEAALLRQDVAAYNVAPMAALLDLARPTTPETQLAADMAAFLVNDGDKRNQAAINHLKSSKRALLLLVDGHTAAIALHVTGLVDINIGVDGRYHITKREAHTPRPGTREAHQGNPAAAGPSNAAAASPEAPPTGILAQPHPAQGGHTENPPPPKPPAVAAVLKGDPTKAAGDAAGSPASDRRERQQSRRGDEFREVEKRGGRRGGGGVSRGGRNKDGVSADRVRDGGRNGNGHSRGGDRGGRDGRAQRDPRDQRYARDQHAREVHVGRGEDGTVYYTSVVPPLSAGGRRSLVEKMKHASEEEFPALAAQVPPKRGSARVAAAAASSDGQLAHLVPPLRASISTNTSPANGAAANGAAANGSAVDTPAANGSIAAPPLMLELEMFSNSKTHSWADEV